MPNCDWILGPGVWSLSGAIREREDRKPGRASVAIAANAIEFDDEYEGFYDEFDDFSDAEDPIDNPLH